MTSGGYALAYLLVCFLAGCSGGVASFYENSQVAVIDGEEFMVRPLPGGPNIYQATLNRGDLGGPNPVRSGQNVRAIEAVTGCRVDPTSIQNNVVNMNITHAAVVCEG